MKHLEGKTVYLIPTGNNARNRAKGYYQKAVVVKVAKVYATLIIDESRYESKFRFNGNRLDGGYNSGYLLFETEQDIDDHYEVGRLSNKISDNFRYSSDLRQLSLDKLQMIAEILELKEK